MRDILSYFCLMIIRASKKVTSSKNYCSSYGQAQLQFYLPLAKCCYSYGGQSLKSVLLWREGSRIFWGWYTVGCTS